MRCLPSSTKLQRLTSPSSPHLPLPSPRQIRRQQSGRDPARERQALFWTIALHHRLTAFLAPTPTYSTTTTTTSAAALYPAL
ncbi:hypothetical protein CIB48_g4175 [Xylaria polymorpha]|nr:hypothetical protein CIB48_g4175 [Xylaria polymorpha]